MRYRVLALVCGLSMVTYLDRVCFGAAAPLLADELGLGDASGLKWAFTAFAVAYALFEVPAGWLGDRFGPRATLIRIVAWWSACTALTGAVGLTWGGVTWGGFATLVVLRFLFGAGEAGAYPNIARAIHNWFPADQWDFAQGLVWMSGRLIGGLTPLVWATLVVSTADGSGWVTWRGAFALFGLVGIAWCLLFALAFRNRPEEHPRVNRAERELIGTRHAPTARSDRVPWRALATNRSLWALCGMYFLVNYGWVFNITYLPAYLEERFGLAGDNRWAALYKGAPLWVGAMGCFAGGVAARWLSRRLGGRGRGRRCLGMAALVLCALCWTAARWAENVHSFCGLISLAALGIDLTLGATWATCHDLGRRYAAVTAAVMNTIGTLGSAVAAWFTGTIVQHAVRAAELQSSFASLTPPNRQEALLAGYQTVFATYAAVYLVAAACWLAIDPERPVADDGTPPDSP